MERENKYVLAMYDIRGKQQYIYRSNHLKEIIGGSAIIRDCFKDYLYPAAKIYRNEKGRFVGDEEAIFCYSSGEKEFSVSKFKERMSGEQYIGEVVYDGGGTFFILYKNETICREINKRFTRKVLKETYTLKVLCTYITDVHFDNFLMDRENLYYKHQLNEGKENGEIPAQVLPFTQVDYHTSMPLYKICEAAVEAPRSRVTRESYKKYEKVKTLNEKDRKIFGVNILDEMVTQKGEESLLAIVYIDGNNMGAKMQQCLEGKDPGYESAVKELRDFSASIQENYIDKRIEDIDRMLSEKKCDGKGNKHRRFVIYAGDEINFICNARDAYDAVKTYMKGLPAGNSACAGISIFHSHAPYAEVYRIAEECCESGKKKMKEEKLEDACLVDVHYCQSGIGTSLEKIRESEVGELISKPWFVNIPDGCKNQEYITLEKVEALAAELRKAGRSNVKSLAEHAKNSRINLKMELERIQAHSKENFDFTLGGQLNEEQMQKMIYDIVIVYDLWFDKNNTEGEGEDE